MEYENGNQNGEENNISEVDKLFVMLGQNDDCTQQRYPNLGFGNNKIFPIDQFSFASQSIVDIANKCFERGIEQFEAVDFEASIAFYDKALELKPDLHKAWYNRGNALRYLGRHKDAIASYNKALEFKPDYHLAWNCQGIALGNLGRYEDAIASYDKALEFKPDDDLAWYNRGLALRNLGRYEDAIVSYNKALEFKPDEPLTLCKRGLALSYLGDYEDAIASYDKALKIKPDYHKAWYCLGMALLDLERYEDAVASYDKALKIKPDYHEAWHFLGITLRNLERYEDAIASYDKALKIKPDYHEAWNNRGVALGYLGRYEERIASYDKALEIKPDKHNTWLNRGITAGESISVNQFLASSSTIARQNPALNQRGYEGKLASYLEGLKYCHQNTHPEGWGILHQAMGKAHYFQGKILQEREKNPNYHQYWDKAETEYKQALVTLTSGTFPELHLKVLQDLICVLFGLAKDNEAKQWRKQGLNIFKNLLNSPDKSSFQKRQLRAKFSDFSQMRVDVLIEDGDFVPALEAAERNKNFYLTWILDNQKEHILSPSYREIQRLINPQTAPNTAIIYWHISPFALSTFIIKPDTNRPIVIPTQKPDELKAWVKDWDKQYENYREGKQQQQPNPTWRDNLPELLERLSEILNISHIIESIQNPSSNIQTSQIKIQNLILIPHRDLHRFPLHALFTDDFSINYLPSAQIGTNLQQKLVVSHPNSFLSVESPDSKESDGKEFTDLPHAEVESATICGMFANPQRLIRNQVSKKNLKRALAHGYKIFHFTGHATYNYHKPQLSCLALSGKDRLTSEDITHTQLPLYKYQMVSLSACETAITGNQTIDDEYVGLVSAFLSQGVTNVLSTLWTVESVSSALFMIEFYRQPDWNITPAVALKRTQIWLRNVTYKELVNWYKQRAEEISKKDVTCAEDLLDEAEIIEGDHTKINKTVPPYAHPYYWAAFIITGKIHS